MSELVDNLGLVLSGLLKLEWISADCSDCDYDFVSLRKSHLVTGLDVGHCDSFWCLLRMVFAKSYLVDVKPYLFRFTLLLEDFVVGLDHLGVLGACSLEKLHQSHVVQIVAEPNCLGSEFLDVVDSMVAGYASARDLSRIFFLGFCHWK